MENNNEVTDEHMIQTIAEFIELGHVDNIVEMFRADSDYYRLTGELLRDERFMVRVGMTILFETLVGDAENRTELAIPYLLPLLTSDVSYIRGEATSILGIINTRESLDLVRKQLGDRDPQVAEIARDCLAGQ